MEEKGEKINVGEYVDNLCNKQYTWCTKTSKQMN